ncbi:MAG: hypothetical protein HRU35_02795 [Rickettsiaceae bacterium]|nr:hypothetical protein [Rickettsiaceae bacterium]
MSKSAIVTTNNHNHSRKRKLLRNDNGVTNPNKKQKLTINDNYNNHKGHSDNNSSELNKEYSKLTKIFFKLKEFSSMQPVEYHQTIAKFANEIATCHYKVYGLNKGVSYQQNIPLLYKLAIFHQRQAIQKCQNKDHETTKNMEQQFVRFMYNYVRAKVKFENFNDYDAMEIVHCLSYTIKHSFEIYKYQIHQYSNSHLSMGDIDDNYLEQNIAKLKEIIFHSMCIFKIVHYDCYPEKGKLLDVLFKLDFTKNNIITEQIKNIPIFISQHNPLDTVTKQIFNSIYQPVIKNIIFNPSMDLDKKNVFWIIEGALISTLNSNKCNYINNDEVKIKAMALICEAFIIKELLNSNGIDINNNLVNCEYIKQLITERPYVLQYILEYHQEYSFTKKTLHSLQVLHKKSTHQHNNNNVSDKEELEDDNNENDHLSIKNINNSSMQDIIDNDIKSPLVPIINPSSINDFNDDLIIHQQSHEEYSSCL